MAITLGISLFLIEVTPYQCYRIYYLLILFLSMIQLLRQTIVTGGDWTAWMRFGSF